MAVSIPEEDLRHETPHDSVPDLNPVATVILKSWQQLINQGHKLSQRPQAEVLRWEAGIGGHQAHRRPHRRVVSRSL